MSDTPATDEQLDKLRASLEDSSKEMVIGIALQAVYELDRLRALVPSPQPSARFFPLIGKPCCQECQQPEGVILNLSATGFSVTTGFEHLPTCSALRCPHGVLWQDDCATCLNDAISEDE